MVGRIRDLFVSTQKEDGMASRCGKAPWFRPKAEDSNLCSSLRNRLAKTLPFTTLVAASIVFGGLGAAAPVLGAESVGSEAEGKVSQPKKAEEKLEQLTICRDSSVPTGQRGARVRTLRVYESPDQSCRATYSKSQEEQTVGSNRSKKQCRSILDGIKKNLEASHWNCKTMGSVSVLESKELGGAANGASGADGGKSL